VCSIKYNNVVIMLEVTRLLARNIGKNDVYLGDIADPELKAKVNKTLDILQGLAP